MTKRKNPESNFCAVASLICIMHLPRNLQSSSQLYFQESSFFPSPNHKFSYESDVSVDVTELLVPAGWKYIRNSTAECSPGIFCMRLCLW